MSELKDSPCLVLLGDVGMGKSTTLEKEAEDLKATLARQKHAVAYMFGKAAKLRQTLRQCAARPPQAIYLGDEIRDAEGSRQGRHCVRRSDVGTAPSGNPRARKPAHIFTAV